MFPEIFAYKTIIYASYKLKTIGQAWFGVNQTTFIFESNRFGQKQANRPLKVYEVFSMLPRLSALGQHHRFFVWDRLNPDLVWFQYSNSYIICHSNDLFIAETQFYINILKNKSVPLELFIALKPLKLLGIRHFWLNWQSKYAGLHSFSCSFTWFNQIFDIFNGSQRNLISTNVNCRQKCTPGDVILKTKKVNTSHFVNFNATDAGQVLSKPKYRSPCMQSLLILNFHICFLYKFFKLQKKNFFQKTSQLVIKKDRL